MALSKVNAVRQKISVTLTVAFLDLKLTVYPKVKELRLRVKRSVRGSKGKTTVSNTEAAKVRKMEAGGAVTKPKRPFRGKAIKGTAVARGMWMRNARAQKENQRFCNSSMR